MPTTTPAVALSSIALYQPDSVLQQRLDGVAALASYLKTLIKQADSYWASLSGDQAQSGEIVVAIRPGGRARFWCEFSSGTVSEAQITELIGRLSKVEAPVVHGGPVAAVLHLSVWGGSPANQEAARQLYVPKEWRAAIQKSAAPVVMPDGVLDVVWPQ